MSQGLKPTLIWSRLLPGLKSRPISKPSFSAGNPCLKQNGFPAASEARCYSGKTLQGPLTSPRAGESVCGFGFGLLAEHVSYGDLVGAVDLEVVLGGFDVEPHLLAGLCGCGDGDDGLTLQDGVELVEQGVEGAGRELAFP